MHDALISYIHTQLTTPLTGSEIALIKETFVHKKLRKHQFLLQEGEVCKWAGFIVKGALKQYAVDESGKENILALFVENWWVGDRESFSGNTPSVYHIDAYEETDLLVISRETYEDKLRDARFMQDLIRVLTERQSLQLLKRLHATKTRSAEERLLEFETNFPHFNQRFPQHIIASYLGMTKETLSRIKSNNLKNK